jgi:tetratricopeptide (TPR) repeat protein
MSQRLTRKEMKRDDFASVLGRSVEYAESHTRNLLLALGGLIAVAAVAVAVYAFFAHRSTAAGEALNRAIKVYAAPIQAVGAKPADPTDPNTPSFPDEASRNRRAVQLLNAVRDGYAHTQAAGVAGVYLGRIAASEGKLDQARKLWSDYAEGNKNSLAAAVRLNLIDLDRRQGKSEEVVGRLKPMLDDSDPPLPKDAVLYQLGLTYEQLQRRPEAAGAFRQILDEFPQSAYRQEAQQKVAVLDPTHGSPMGNLGMGGLGMPGGAVPGDASGL